VNLFCLFVCFGATAPKWVRASSFARSLDHTRHTTVGRTPLDECSARRTDLYLTIFTTDKSPCPGGIRNHNLRRRTAADLRLRQRGKEKIKHRNGSLNHIVTIPNFVLASSRSVKLFSEYTRWFKYDRDRFVCKQAALRSSCATLRE